MKIISLSRISKRKVSQAEPITRTTTNNIRRLEMHPTVAVGKLGQNGQNNLFNNQVLTFKILASLVCYRSGLPMATMKG